MTKATRTWMGALILAASLVGTAPAAAQYSKSTTLMVVVIDHAGVPARILEKATAEAARAFQKINVDVIWLEHGDVRLENADVLRSVVIVHIPTREMVDRMKSRESVLGRAASGNRLVKVFYNRIEDLSPAHRGNDIGSILGHVVAHEIGHVLLPTSAHSPSGIMQAGLDTQVAVGRTLSFTKSQAQAIRTKIADYYANWPDIALTQRNSRQFR